MRSDDLAALLFAIEYHDEHETLAGALDHWDEIVDSLERRDSRWADGQHFGDCTKNAISCQRCFVEEIQERAGALAEDVEFDAVYAMLDMLASE